ncbi:Ig-like domain-containing protein [Algoriphagus sp. H41]|uniref:Ig-like domain-containing protein n=1 Tax=Algoriphagus oliviformis TaxID=2811231 RepID=A0ABS3C9G8_9BACT|nr:glucoamylase family protein [Algoriphagus oliviformis]MBN7813693.1 Ig-like domain-containing protein [Algoriphagus oliviformis]
MKPTLFLLAFLLFLGACREDENPDLLLLEASAGTTPIPLDGSIVENIPLDRGISLKFSENLDAGTAASSFILRAGSQTLPTNINLPSGNTVTIQALGGLQSGQVHQLEILGSLRSASGTSFPGQTLSFKTQSGSLAIESASFAGEEALPNGTIQNVTLAFSAEIKFNFPLDPGSLQSGVQLTGPSSPSLAVDLSSDQKTLQIRSSAPLSYLSKYRLSLSSTVSGANGETFSGWQKDFYTSIDPNPKFPAISDEALLTKVQEHTFRYFWDFAHPASGMARERNTSGNTVTSGGSGFGVMALIVGVERGFISRTQAVERWTKVIGFLEKADRFHGVWPHWLNGETGKTIPFSAKDNGGDLVETALLMQGLLTVQAYLDPAASAEKSLSDRITTLWRGVEWDWYTKNNSGVLYWHWSPDFAWEMNLPVSGYNESLIVYVLAASSPTHPISKSTYDQGWARNGAIRNGKSFYGEALPLGVDYGGPLFFSHYSFLGLDPRNLRDQYANYWEQNVQHSLINQAHAVANPKSFVAYSEDNWGFTASDNHQGYNAHSPTNDLGVVTPTAALSSFPYTPEESMKAMRFFYYALGDRTWGDYGFYDAFNVSESWYADSYLAIDQGPIILMIENHRSALLWNLFMKNTEVKAGLDKLGFSY